MKKMNKQFLYFTNVRHSVVLIMIAAFLCYTGMYAVRKSFLAAQYDGTSYELISGVDYKVLLVISQVLGYMLSKFVGIKVISEMSSKRRSVWLVILVSFGLFMLLAFYILPPGWKVLAMFLNGLPLGMVFGIVFSYLEGRRNTELLAAALSATFIFSTGLVKNVGVVMMSDFGIDEFAMPFVTGLLFFPLFLLSVMILNRVKGPDKEDKMYRTERNPMNGKERKEFIVTYTVGFVALIIMYVILTIVRDFRDNFIVEFWAELGYSEEPGILTLTEIPIAISVVIIAGLGFLIKRNLLAFNMGMIATILSAFLILIATYLFKANQVSPVFWMIATGTGIYLPYILFHCLIFERLIAFLKYSGNVGFLFYSADALGYLFSVLVLLMKEIFSFDNSWVHFLIELNINAAIGLISVSFIALVFFNKWVFLPRKAIA